MPVNDCQLHPVLWLVQLPSVHLPKHGQPITRQLWNTALHTKTVSQLRRAAVKQHMNVRIYKNTFNSTLKTNWDTFYHVLIHITSCMRQSIPQWKQSPPWCGRSGCCRTPVWPPGSALVSAERKHTNKEEVSINTRYLAFHRNNTFFRFTSQFSFPTQRSEINKWNEMITDAVITWILGRDYTYNGHCGQTEIQQQRK